MNQKQAIEFATMRGLQVSNTVKNKNGSREFKVGTIRVHHDNDGGKGCWKVEGKRIGYIGDAIVAAVNQ